MFVPIVLIAVAVLILCAIVDSAVEKSSDAYREASKRADENLRTSYIDHGISPPTRYR